MFLQDKLFEEPKLLQDKVLNQRGITILQFSITKNGHLLFDMLRLLACIGNTADEFVARSPIPEPLEKCQGHRRSIRMNTNKVLNRIRFSVFDDAHLRRLPWNIWRADVCLKEFVYFLQQKVCFKTRWHVVFVHLLRDKIMIFLEFHEFLCIGLVIPIHALNTILSVPRIRIIVQLLDGGFLHFLLVECGLLRRSANHGFSIDAPVLELGASEAHIEQQHVVSELHRHGNDERDDHDHHQKLNTLHTIVWWRIDLASTAFIVIFVDLPAT
mmetsp:Transcript_15712/g.26239  ORF Transcript_15712/g.26239 Transcript_15712/m.26239 type:complete len:270 (+) Transcript_15712:2715-3524(+)